MAEEIEVVACSLRLGRARLSGDQMFDFGAGPVPARQHPPGGGWVANTAYVSPTAFVGPDARVYDSAYVGGRSWIGEQSRVYGYASIDRSEVGGEARVFGNASLEHARIHGCARVSAPVRFGTVRSTVTDRAIVIIGGEYEITITDDAIHVGCQDGTIEEWETKAPESCPRLEAMRSAVLEIARVHQKAVQERNARCRERAAAPPTDWSRAAVLDIDATAVATITVPKPSDAEGEEP